VSYKTEVIDVQVISRILWVGGDAYPLHNIARVQPSKLVPRRGPALWNYFKAIVLWVLLGVAAVVVIGLFWFGSNALLGLVAVVVLVLIVNSTIKLISATRTFYELVIETAGTPYTALVNPDWKLIIQLVHMITDAINDPQAEFHVQVVNHFGDNIKITGDRNVGKVSK
jgi:hypothetical protein